MNMGKRRLKRSGAEQDAMSRWGRRYLCYLSRAGVISSIKRGYRQRERARAKQDIREEKYE
jgi:hypothetical protein